MHCYCGSLCEGYTVPLTVKHETDRDDLAAKAYTLFYVDLLTSFDPRNTLSHLASRSATNPFSRGRGNLEICLPKLVERRIGSGGRLSISIMHASCASSTSCESQKTLGQ